MAHIHQGKQGVNGPVVVVLYKGTTPTGIKNGALAQGSITASQLEGILKGKQISDLVNMIKSGDATQMFILNRIQKEKSEDRYPNGGNTENFLANIFIC